MDSKQKRQAASIREKMESALGKKTRTTNPMRKERFTEGQKARRKAGLKKGFRKVASALNPVGSAVSTAKKIFGKKKNKPDFQKGDYSKISVK